MEEQNKPARHKKWSFKESLYFNIGAVFLAVPCFITSVMEAESVYHPQPIKMLIYIGIAAAIAVTWVEIDKIRPYL